MQDSEDIDPRNWHEWLQLFIDQLPISNEKTVTEEIVLDLDQMELQDYLKNEGQWPTTLVSDNQPNLEQILTGQTDAVPVAGAKGGKAPAPKQAAAEQIQLEEGDTELPLQAPNNFFLGDALEVVIDMNFEPKPQYKRPKVPNYHSLKLCFVGYAFSGKKTQAARLKEAMPDLHVYQLHELVSEAVAFYESHPDSFDEGAEQQEEEDPDASEDSFEDQSYNAEEDFRKCGEKITTLIKEGQEIPDEVYVELFVAKLRMTYPHQSKAEQRSKLRAQVQKEREISVKI